MSDASIVHYRHKCIGCGSCADLAPHFWTMSANDGKATLLLGKNKRGRFVRHIDLEDTEANERAAADCPVKIIQIGVKTHA